jgi:hypothetical protein
VTPFRSVPTDRHEVPRSCSWPLREPRCLSSGGLDHAPGKTHSAKTALVTYARVWPDPDESTRPAVDAVMKARAEELRDSAAE